MGVFSRVEDRPTPQAVYNWRVYLSAAIAAAAAVMIGYDGAFIGTTIALPSFVAEFKFGQLSSSDVNLISANIVSCYQAGAFFGCFLAYPVGHFLGRRIGLLISAAVFCVGAALMLGVNGDRGLALLYVGRVLAGFGVGAASNLTPIYISEVSPPSIRGMLVGFYELAWQIGAVVGFWINYGVSLNMVSNHDQWIVPIAVQLIPSGLFFIGCFWVVESPRWLLAHGKRSHGIKNLEYLRQLPATDIYMREEIAAIDAALEVQRSAVGVGFWGPFFSVFKSQKLMYRFFLGGSLFFWQNTSGINAINYYSPTIFKSLGVKGSNTGLLTTGIFGIIKFSGTLVWLFFMIDNIGRRNLLMIGAFGGSLCLWYVGAYVAIAEPAKNAGDTMSQGGISAMAFFYLWTVFYSPSWNGTPWVLNSEMFDQNVRELAQAFAASNNWFWNFLVARFTPQMFAAMGKDGSGFGVYFFFASLMMLSVPYVFFLVPETKGIPLESTDRLFEDGHSARNAHNILVRQLREEEDAFRSNIGDLGLEKEGFEPVVRHDEGV